jgi:hypothetical protein
MRLIMFLTSITLLFNWFNDAKLGVKTHQNKKNGNARLARPLHFHLGILS